MPSNPRSPPRTPSPRPSTRRRSPPPRPKKRSSKNKSASRYLSVRKSCPQPRHPRTRSLSSSSKQRRRKRRSSLFQPSRVCTETLEPAPQNSTPTISPQRDLEDLPLHAIGPAHHLLDAAPAGLQQEGETGDTGATAGINIRLKYSLCSRAKFQTFLNTFFQNLLTCNLMKNAPFIYNLTASVTDL